MTIKLTRLDLDYILTQIQMAEAGQLPVNPLLSFGLREVAGTNNNLAPGQSTFGASDVVFPTLTDPMFQTAQLRHQLCADQRARHRLPRRARSACWSPARTPRPAPARTASSAPPTTPS